MHKGIEELVDAYRGEVAGEAFFAALAEQTPDPAHAEKWRTLARLENAVAARIRGAFVALGIKVPATDSDWERGLRSVREYAELSWKEALEKMRPELDRYVNEFEAAESRMPAELLPLARFVTAHERALLRFVDMELANQSAGSLGSVLELLGLADLNPRAGGLAKS